MHNGEYVSDEEIEQIPEIINARAEMIEIQEQFGVKESIDLPLEMRLEAKDRITANQTGDPGYEVKTDKRLDIVIGFPAAGKSSAIVKNIQGTYQSRIIDSDDVKTQLESHGFRNGIGANFVHRESAEINKEIGRICRDRGENIILPIIGSDAEKVKKDYIDEYKAQGYSVFVHYVDVTPPTSRERVIRRFVTDNRFVDYQNLKKYTDAEGLSKCDESFEILKNDPDVEGYTHWDNDVEGYPPELVESKNFEIEKKEDDSPKDVGNEERYGDGDEKPISMDDLLTEAIGAADTSIEEIKEDLDAKEEKEHPAEEKPQDMEQKDTSANMDQGDTKDQKQDNAEVKTTTDEKEKQVEKKEDSVDSSNNNNNNDPVD